MLSTPNITDDLTPDEVLLQPDDYEIPAYVKESYRLKQHRLKVAVVVKRDQITYFGERGVPWVEIEKFYNVDRKTLQSYYAAEYEKGVAKTNIALRSKQLELALSGNPTMLIWLSKNRLGMSDAGAVSAEDVAGDDDPTVIKVVRPEKATK